jgi:hypothetical protein
MCQKRRWAMANSVYTGEDIKTSRHQRSCFARYPTWTLLFFGLVTGFPQTLRWVLLMMATEIRRGMARLDISGLRWHRRLAEFEMKVCIVWSNAIRALWRGLHFMIFAAFNIFRSVVWAVIINQTVMLKFINQTKYLISLEKCISTKI